MKRLLLALLFLAAPALAQDVPAPLSQYFIPTQVSANGVSNLVLSAPRKAWYSATVITGATAGFFMVIDGTVLPANGAIAACATTATTRPCQAYCVPVAASDRFPIQWLSPVLMQSGVVLAFSSAANCDTLTASATAKFMGQAL